MPRPYYNTCPNCGSNLDPGETCECERAKTNTQLFLALYDALTPENRMILKDMLRELAAMERPEKVVS